jgi:hypothetical protein
LRHFWIKTFQIISILLLVFLVISTFIPQISEYAPGEYPGAANGVIRFFQLDRFYNSPINIALWAILSLIIIGSILFKGIRNPIQKINHLILALIFIVVIIEKSTNRRFEIAIREGEEVCLSDDIDTISEKRAVFLKLLRFEIQQHPDQSTPKAFISHLLVNHQDTVQLAVNRPLAIDHCRLYQSAYDREMLFNLQINGQDYPVLAGDTLQVDTTEFIFEGFSHQRRVFDLKIGGKYYHTGIKQPRRIQRYDVMIQPGEMRYTSIIEVAEIRWTKLLLVLAVLYLTGLAFSFWRRKSAK